MGSFPRRSTKSQRRQSVTHRCVLIFVNGIVIVVLILEKLSRKSEIVVGLLVKNVKNASLTTQGLLCHTVTKL